MKNKIIFSLVAILMNITFLNNVFAGFLVEPTIGYSAYTRDELKVFHESTSLPVGHSGATVGLRGMFDTSFLFLGFRYFSTSKTSFTADLNGFKSDIDNFSFFQTGVLGGFNFLKRFKLYMIYDFNIDTTRDGVNKKLKSFGAGLNIKVSFFNLIFENAKIIDDDNPDYEDRLFTISLGVPLNIF